MAEKQAGIGVIEGLWNSIISRADMSLIEKAVLIELARKQGSSAKIQVSHAYLAKGMNLAKSSIKKAIGELISKRLINCKRRKISAHEHDLNEYSVIWVNNYNRKRAWLKRQERVGSEVA